MAVCDARVVAWLTHQPTPQDFHTDCRDAIVDFLEAGPAPYDACLCGTRGLKGALARFMLGSVTRFLLLYAPCPVLVLPGAVLREHADAAQSGPPA